MPRRNERSTYNQGPIGPEKTVGEPATDDRGKEGQAIVPAVQLTGLLPAPAQPAGARVDEVQDEQSAHPVVREAFPELGDEQDHQPGWLPVYLGTSTSMRDCRS